MNIKNNIRVALMALAALLATGPLTSCSDEPDSDHFYTFTGEMMSDYMSNRPQYSKFKTIVERAKLMDLLATYGQYTCFMPNDSAVDNFLKTRGLTSVSQLSDADCDTIARTHIVANMYSTFEMDQDRLITANLLGRYLATSQGMDRDSNAVVYLEGTAHIIFRDTVYNADGSVLEIVHQNDSVENGIVQPIDMVIEKSNSYIADILRQDSTIMLFYQALVATGVREQILLVEDATYSKRQPKYYYKSHVWQEVAWVPDTKKYGYTAFVEPDSIYEKIFKEGYDLMDAQGGVTHITVDTSRGNLYAMYDLARQIYDPVYGNNTKEGYNDNTKEGWKFENLTDPINPLHRFMQYHFMNRYVAGTSDLIALIPKETKEPFGFDTELANAIDWYPTLLPHTMLKVEMLSRKVHKDPILTYTNSYDYVGEDAAKKGGIFLNRRYASPVYKFRGSFVDATVDKEHVHDALNGHYFYVDDIVAFSDGVQNNVQNQRIRLDFSSVFGEVMTNDMRLKGNYTVDDPQDRPDDSNTPKNGRNFYFPNGYLDGVTFKSDCYLVMRRPHCNFWSWQGDEWNLFGDYDITFRIPPVPYSGDWQLRLGFCSIPTRGVMQVYYGDDPNNLIPQGIPLDMTKDLNSEMYIGERFTDYDTYLKKTDEERAEEQKVLKNLGAYRDGRSMYIFNSGGGKTRCLQCTGMYRRVLCQTYIDAGKDHYLRFRVASDGKQGNNNEFMLDYFEMVPKSVYGVDSDGQMEDDL